MYKYFGKGVFKKYFIYPFERHPWGGVWCGVIHNSCLTASNGCMIRHLASHVTVKLNLTFNYLLSSMLLSLKLAPKLIIASLKTLGKSKMNSNFCKLVKA